MMQLLVEEKETITLDDSDENISRMQKEDFERCNYWSRKKKRLRWTIRMKIFHEKKDFERLVASRFQRKRRLHNRKILPGM